MLRHLFFLLIAGSASACLASELTLVEGGEDSDTVQIKMQSGRDACCLWVDSTDSIDRGSCQRLINSKRTVIYCTPHKKLCKTQQEIQTFVASPPTTEEANENIHYSRDFQTCLDNSMGATSLLIACNRAELQRQDHLLNRAYKQAMRQLDPNHQRKLTYLQKLWIRYRDVKCGFLSDLTGGTMDAVITESCYVDTTARRVKELKEIVY
jgi:uncharacterized protein YecT (DUF1311 family)